MRNLFTPAILFLWLGCTYPWEIKENLNVHSDLIDHLDPELKPFYHGVASGDPQQSGIIIWTRVTLDKSVTEAEVLWEVAKDSLFVNVVQSGTTRTSAEKDFTVKVDVQGLDVHTAYFYRFRYKNRSSVTGRTQTLPVQLDEYHIAFTSCSNYEWGYFHNYRFIAEDPDIDLVVHLGDYIYEYGVGGYGDTAIGRFHVPEQEITTLSDYRTRYSLYRLDKDLRNAHQNKAFITTWDDHEIANNAYDSGAQNHQEQEGDWHERKRIARKAYYEWLPVRKKGEEPLYRSFSLGNLANLIVLDTRLDGRTKQVSAITDPAYTDTTRAILGAEQFTWLTRQLKIPGKWKIICNQVPFGPMFLPDSVPGRKYLDGWDGYPYEREKLVRFLQSESVKNTAIITGDYHQSFAMETDLSGTAEAEDNVAVEFVVTSITSANMDERYPPEEVERLQRKTLANNPHMKYCNNRDHGYLVLQVGDDHLSAAFTYASTVTEPDAYKRTERVYVVRDGKSALY